MPASKDHRTYPSYFPELFQAAKLQGTFQLPPMPSGPARNLRQRLYTWRLSLRNAAPELAAPYAGVIIQLREDPLNPEQSILTLVNDEATPEAILVREALSGLDLDLDVPELPELDAFGEPGPIPTASSSAVEDTLADLGFTFKGGEE